MPKTFHSFFKLGVYILNKENEKIEKLIDILAGTVCKNCGKTEITGGYCEDCLKLAEQHLAKSLIHFSERKYKLRKHKTAGQALTNKVFQPH